MNCENQIMHKLTWLADAMLTRLGVEIVVDSTAADDYEKSKYWFTAYSTTHINIGSTCFCDMLTVNGVWFNYSNGMFATESAKLILNTILDEYQAKFYPTY